MGPRKKAKLNSKAGADQSSSIPEDIPQPPQDQNSEKASESSDYSRQVSVGNSHPRSGVLNGSSSSNCWYRGSWPRAPKAAAITQVAKENVSTITEAAASIRVPQSPSLYLSRTAGGSTRSLPVSAATTRVHISSSGLNHQCNAVEMDDSHTVHEQNTEGKSNIDQIKSAEDSGKQSRQQNESSHTLKAAQPETSDSTFDDRRVALERSVEDESGWLAWFSHKNQAPDNTSATTENLFEGKEASKKATSIQNRDETFSPRSCSQDKRRNSDPSPLATDDRESQQRKRLWLPIWGSQSTAPKKFVTTDDKKDALNTSANDPASRQVAKSVFKPTIQDAKPSGWSFWSRGTATEVDKHHLPRSTVGELVVADPESQPKSAKAVAADARGPLVASSENTKSKPSSTQTTACKAVGSVPGTRKDAAISATPLKKSPYSKADGKDPPESLNLILPSFKRTFRVKDNRGYLQQLGQLIYRAKEPRSKHVDLLKEPLRIQKALTIGIHGYFPAPLIRSVLGQPTGTSIKFADLAAKAVKQWVQTRGYSCEIEQVALEGEGKIEDRVQLLWRLMLNWLEAIRKADFILIACHSQGVPVAIMLVAKLVGMGCLNGIRVGVCAMAGVNLGPFADYKSRWIGGSAGELFDFAQPDSRVSKDYETALNIVLTFGVKLLYIGSIDDQLVSLESSTFSIVEHPHIFRAVFVDGRIHVPDFLTLLVGFALKLRNLGVSDHGLIRELSSPLAGSLYGGEGHSRIYEDPAVYSLAVQHALETTTLEPIPLEIRRPATRPSQNPYILPFAMRGLLEEDYVRGELQSETDELLKQFDNWKPASKVLKNVKFRLEGIRSKL